MKTIIKSIPLFFAALVLLGSGCQEDTIELTLTGSIEGWVVNDNQDSLAQVIITTNPATESTTTDESGYFLLENIPVGDYTVRANKEGYREEIATLTVVEEEPSEAFIILSRIPEGNIAPTAAHNPVPANGASGLPLSVDLSWEASDENEQDTLRYRVILFSDAAPAGEEVAGDLDTTAFRLEGLSYEADYAWQVIVDDGTAAPVFSEIWHFTTEPFPDFPIHFVRKENGRYVIYGMTKNGEQRARLSDSNQDCWRPRMSPNRDKMAFLSFVDGNIHLFTMDRDGSNVQQLTPAGFPVGGHQPFELDFCWTSGSDRLLYMNFDKLYSINRDGAGLAEIATAPAGQYWVEVDVPEQGYPEFIVARTRSVLPYESWVYGLLGEDGFAPELLMDNPMGSVGGPALFIDGSQMLVTVDQYGNQSASGQQLDARIMHYNLGNGQLTDLSENKEAGFNHLDPRYDPTGAEVIFVKTPVTLNGPKDLFVMKINDPAEPTLLVENAEMPDWQ